MHMRDLSHELRLWGPPVAVMAIIFAFSSMPASDDPHGVLYVATRKVAHIAEYALLLALWWRALRTRTGERRALGFALAIALAYAISDELHQTLVSGRSGRPLDVGIDMGGALAAAALIGRRRLRRRAAA